MNVLVTSSQTLLTSSRTGLDTAVVSSLLEISDSGTPVVLISNHPEPDWFKATFGASRIAFWHAQGRQTGEGLRSVASHLKISTHEILVLASTSEDLQMAKNGGAVLIAASWAADKAVSELGIKVADPRQLANVVALVSGWRGGWWFESQDSDYRVIALADLSSYGKAVTQQQFSERVTHTVKQGDHRLTALLTMISRSLLSSGILSDPSKTLWGVYPSSQSTNDDTDVLSDFTHRLRTTVSRVRFARREEPLFIRHTASPKRSAGGGGDRTDPTSQLNTLHLNPSYQRNISGRTVIVIDDVTTYGVSFGVAAAMLRKAGAKQTIGIALGKFGSQLKRYDIDIAANPFARLGPGSYKIRSKTDMMGTTDATAQDSLLKLV